MASEKTLICARLTGRTVSQWRSQAFDALNGGADLAELRLDLLAIESPPVGPDFDVLRFDLAALLADSPLPVAVSFNNSGYTKLNEDLRIEMLRTAVYLGAAFVEVELTSAKRFFKGFPLRREFQRETAQTRTQFIISSYDFATTPSTSALEDLIEQCQDAGADIVKIITKANDITDAYRILGLANCDSLKRPLVATALGIKGEISTLLAPKHGMHFTYAPLTAASDGYCNSTSQHLQPTLSQLQNIYNFRNQNKTTRIFGLIGNPISHSKSPAVHNAAMLNANVDGVYVPFVVDHGQLPSFLNNISDLNCAGFSVTSPHKEVALQIATHKDTLAEPIGAANTLIRQADGTYKAFNTDCSAAVLTLEKALGNNSDNQTLPNNTKDSSLKGLKVVIIGAGGAGKAVAFGAASKGATVIIANRAFCKAKALATQLQSIGAKASACTFHEVSSGEITGDVLVNATTLGMYGADVDSTPIARKSALKRYKLVFDVVYTPSVTRLLLDAKDAGCQIVSGEDMFWFQAAEQFKLFTGGSLLDIEKARRNLASLDVN